MYWVKTNTAAMKVIRHDRRITQRELAKKAGVHFTTISKIEKGIRNPKGITADNIAKALNVPFEAIFFEELIDECQKGS